MENKNNYYISKGLNFFILLALLVVNFGEKIVKGEINSFILFIIVLGYILNSLSRMHIMNEDNLMVNSWKIIFFSISIILEFGFIAYFIKGIGSEIVVLSFVLITDIFIFYKEIIGRSIVLSLIFGLGIELHLSSGLEMKDLIFYIGSVVIFALMSYHIRECEKKKKEAHDLYDRLRISDEKLIQANEELKSFSKTIEEITVLRERTRVSRELHDSVGHALSTLCIQLKAVDTIMDRKVEVAKEMLKKNITYVEDTLDGVRRTVREMKPKDLEIFEGIIAIDKLIRDFEAKTQIETRFILSNEKWAMDSEMSLNIYRIVQESLSNALKHGKAKNVLVSIQFLPEKLYLNIKDDGLGSNDFQISFGLKGIEERINGMGGDVEYSSECGDGFTTSITIPKMVYL